MSPTNYVEMRSALAAFGSIIDKLESQDQSISALKATVFNLRWAAMRRTIEAWQHSAKHRAFRGWRAVQLGRHERETEIVRGAVNRLQMRERTECFHAWLEHVREAIAARRTLARGVRRMWSFKTAKAFDGWLMLMRARSARAGAARALFRRAVAQFACPEGSDGHIRFRAFNSLRFFAARGARQRALFRASVLDWRHRHERALLLFWCQRASARAHRQAALEQVQVMKRLSMLRRVLAGWHVATVREQEARANALNADLLEANKAAVERAMQAARAATDSAEAAAARSEAAAEQASAAMEERAAMLTGQVEVLRSEVAVLWGRPLGGGVDDNDEEEGSGQADAPLAALADGDGVLAASGRVSTPQDRRGSEGALLQPRRPSAPRRSSAANHAQAAAIAAASAASSQAVTSSRAALLGLASLTRRVEAVSKTASDGTQQAAEAQAAAVALGERFDAEAERAERVARETAKALAAVRREARAQAAALRASVAHLTDGPNSTSASATTTRCLVCSQWAAVEARAPSPPPALGSLEPHGAPPHLLSSAHGTMPLAGASGGGRVWQAQGGGNSGGGGDAAMRQLFEAAQPEEASAIVGTDGHFYRGRQAPGTPQSLPSAAHSPTAAPAMPHKLQHGVSPGSPGPTLLGAHGGRQAEPGATAATPRARPERGGGGAHSALAASPVLALQQAHKVEMLSIQQLPRGTGLRLRPHSAGGRTAHAKAPPIGAGGESLGSPGVQMHIPFAPRQPSDLFPAKASPAEAGPRPASAGAPRARVDSAVETLGVDAGGNLGGSAQSAVGSAANPAATGGAAALRTAEAWMSPGDELTSF